MESEVGNRKMFLLLALISAKSPHDFFISNFFRLEFNSNMNLANIFVKDMAHFLVMAAIQKTLFTFKVSD